MTKVLSVDTEKSLYILGAYLKQVVQFFFPFNWEDEDGKEISNAEVNKNFNFISENIPHILWLTEWI